MTDQGYALYDWRTRRRLDITPEQIERNIRLAIKAVVELEANMGHLVHLLTLDEEIERLFSTLAEVSEAPDNVGSD